MSKPHRPLANLPLQRKLLGLIALAVFASVCIGAVVFALYDVTTYRPRAIDGARAQVAGLAQVVAAAIEFDDPTTAQHQLQAFARQPNVRALAIVLNSGAVFAEYHRPGADVPRFQARPANHRLPRDVVAVKAQVLSESGPIAVVHMVQDLRLFSSRMLDYLVSFAVGLITMAALTLILSIALRRAITTPVQELVAAARDVAEQRDYGLRVAAHRDDEIGQLARQFNVMLAVIEEHERALRQSEATALQRLEEQQRAENERASLEAQLRQSHKMQALGTLAGGIAHDFNNVLTAIGGNARLALQDLPDDHAASISLREITQASDRAKGLVRRILTFSRQEQMERRLIDVREIVEETLRLLRATVPTMIELRCEGAADLPKVLADPTQLQQVLMNLGTNAVDAMEDRGGVLTVALERVMVDSSLQAISPDLRTGPHVRIRVVDTGRGIEPSIMHCIFDPFFTTKPPGRGTGLGLSVVHGIMRSHQGAVMVSSEFGAGSTFDLYFPATQADAAAPEAASPAAAAPLGRGEHVLYVDDEEPLVFLVTRVMQRMGYHTTGMTRADEALAAVRADPRQFDLIISDLGMPGMSGLDLAAELLSLRADLPIIITTGYIRAEDVERATQLGVLDVVLKPATVDEMAQVIRARLDQIAGAATASGAI